MLSTISSLVGAFLNRVRGGFGLDLPKWVRLGALGVAFALLAYTPLTWGWADAGLRVLAGILFGVMWVFGWGSYTDLGRNELGYLDDVECMDWLVGREQEDWGFISRWVRDAAGLMLRGMMITAPAGLLTLNGDFVFSGAGMLLCYELAYHIPSKIKGLNRGPELGEALFGAWVFYWAV